VCLENSNYLWEIDLTADPYIVIYLIKHYHHHYTHHHHHHYYQVTWVPAVGRNRITAMTESRGNTYVYINTYKYIHIYISIYLYIYI
jgi:hypothetical protein